MSPSRAEALDQQAARAAALAAFLLIANQVAARAVRDALFLTAFPLTSLPLAMGAAALAALAGAELLSAALARRSPARVVPAAAVLSAVLLAVWYVLSLAWPAAAALLVYVHVAAFGGALVSGFWSLVNERFDPHTARKVVGRIGTGATAGGMAGGALAWLTSQLLPLGASLLLVVALGLLAAAALRRTHAPDGAGATVPMPTQTPPPIAAAILLRNPYLRNVALLVFLGAVAEALVDFQFKAQASERFVSGSRLLGAFAAFHTVMGILSLTLQATLSRAALRQLGIAGTLALRPAADGRERARRQLRAALRDRNARARRPRVPHQLAVPLRLRAALHARARGREAPRQDRRGRVGRQGGRARRQRGGRARARGAARARRVADLRARGGRFARRPGPVASPSTAATSRRSSRACSPAASASTTSTSSTTPRRSTLAHTGHLERDALLRQIAALRGEDKSAPPPSEGGGIRGEPSLDALLGLRSGDPRVVRAVLRAHAEPSPELVAAMLPLLAQDPLVPDVVRSLRRVAPRVTGQLVDALLDPTLESVVRRRVPRVLKACMTARSAEGLKAALDDDAFEIRAAAAAALAAIHERSAVVRVSREEALSRVRRELDSGETLERQIPQIFALLSLVLERGPLQIAWAAMRSEDRNLRGTALEYLANVLPEDVFKRLRSCFGAFTWSAEPVPRPVAELADELRTSAIGLQIERPPWRESGETG